MCGVAGFCHITNRSTPDYKTLLQDMQESIVHRGPDDAGIWIKEAAGVALAHQRLAIIDTSAAGHQPMTTADESVVISFNGEIYNHHQLRKKLERRGYRYKSQTDTETILYAYQEWGIKCLERLDGDFAFALYDVKKDELFLARDRIGVLPLYFALQNGMLSFASEIKALWKLPWNTQKTSTQALYHYLTFMVTPAPMTIFESVYKLPAGFYAKIDAHRQLTFKEWYTPLKEMSYAEKKQFSDEQFCLENIRSLLVDSMKKRMMSDVPFGAFLSGGLDSSLNVALMSSFTSKPIKTFSVAFDNEPEMNELKWARIVANRFNTEHHEVIISEKDAFNFYEKMVYHLDEPLADCVCIPFYFVAELAKKQGVSVVQVGEGADELFFGYPTYAQYKNFHDRIWQPAQFLIPQMMRGGVRHAGSLLAGKRLNLVEIVHNWSKNRELFWGGALTFNELQKQKILHKNFLDSSSCPYDPIVAQIYSGMKQEYDSHSIVNYHMNTLKKKNMDDDFSRKMLYLELKQRLPELLLMRANKMALATSVEVRVPFLDHHLVEFMMHVPASLKFKNKQKKYLLKKIARGLLPDAIINRKKMGFAAPTEQWFSHGSYFPRYFSDLMKTSNNHCSKGVNDLPQIFDTSTSTHAVHNWVLQNIWALKL